VGSLRPFNRRFSASSEVLADIFVVPGHWKRLKKDAAFAPKAASFFMARGVLLRQHAILKNFIFAQRRGRDLFRSYFPDRLLATS
jgi:hypothetical protein